MSSPAAIPYVGSTSYYSVPDPAKRNPTTSEAYSAIVLDHFNNPRNAGELADPDGVGVRTNPVRGDTMRLMIRVADGRGTIADHRARSWPMRARTPGFAPID